MELNRSEWKEGDVAEFQEYLRSKGRPEKEEWTKRIINTSMPVLAVLSGEIKAIVKEISKGNFTSFLDLNIWEYFENTSINGSLIMKIKDFDVMEKYLIPYLNAADNWATCDLLSFPVNAKNKEKWWRLSERLLADEKPFVRRTGLGILFRFVEDEEYVEGIFERINSLENETEYYVNMINAWLVAECFTKQRERTVGFLETNRLNAFTANKAVSKCRDSFRISKEDKEYLLRFKR